MTLRSDHEPEVEYAALIERVRGFVADEVEPHAAGVDREAKFPRGIYGRIAEERLIGLSRPEGAGKSVLEWTLWIEELATASATVADVVLTSDLLAFILGELGSEGQRALLGPLLAGETLGCFALTEKNAGSDAAAVETRAEREDGSYVLTGSKAWITMADVADWAVVLAKTDPEAGTQGITAFLVERGDFTNGDEPYDMMGQRGTAVGELHLAGCGRRPWWARSAKGSRSPCAPLTLGASG